MARRAKEEAERTRTRILASALALFAKRGYAQTTFTDIAARLKLTKGAVYWHFASKEALLLTLIDDMTARFGRMFAAVMPPGEASYPDVAALMAHQTARMLDNAEARAYFQLFHRQIQWTDSSMAAVRRDLLTNRRFGPWEAFRAAVENDVRAGRARPDTDAAQIASVSMAVLDGLVGARIAEFFRSDVEATLRLGFEALWGRIRAVPQVQGPDATSASLPDLRKPVVIHPFREGRACPVRHHSDI